MGHGITGKITDMKFLWLDRTSSRGPQICCVFFWSRSREATGISTEQGIVFFLLLANTASSFDGILGSRRTTACGAHLLFIFVLYLVCLVSLLPSLLIHCFIENSFLLLAAFVTRSVFVRFVADRLNWRSFLLKRWNIFIFRSQDSAQELGINF